MPDEQIFMQVWDPYVEDYCGMGWMLTDSPLVVEDRGGHPCWLMRWPCACRPHYLKGRD